MINNTTNNITIPEKDKAKRNIIIVALTNKVLFIVHLFLYLAVNGLVTLLWAIAVISEPIPFIPIFPILGWGIGIGIHAMTYIMFSEKSQSLIKLRNQSIFGALLPYHALIYCLSNLLVVAANLMAIPENLVFFWPLSMWGIIFSIHLAGILTLESVLKREKSVLKKRFAKYEERQITRMAKWKIFNFWMLITNIAYFIVGNVIIYALSVGDFTLQGTLLWGTTLILQMFAYLFYYHVKSVKAANKGFIIHLVIFGAFMAWGVYQFTLESISTPPLLFIVEPVLIWIILIGFHALVAHRWNLILNSAIETVEKSTTGFKDKFAIIKRAKWLAFWNWSLIAHGSIFSTVMILSVIQILSGIVPLELLLHVAFGEGIAVSIHASIYFVYLRNIREFWKWTFILHGVTFSITGTYLICLNIIFLPSFPVSAIALAGWGIGLGLHYILARYS